jgi:hypothetical protein
MMIHIGRRRQPVTSHLVNLGRVLTDRLFAQADAEARLNGLTVVRTGRGGRIYRHPLFDRFAECTDCDGNGRIGRPSHDGPCTRCRGTGRVMLIVSPHTSAPFEPMPQATPEPSVRTRDSDLTIEEVLQ